MSVARSRLGWQVASAVVLTAVVVWTIAPTYPMEWMGDPNTGAAGPVTFHSWFSPMPFGYGAFHAPLAALCAAISAIGAWLGVYWRKPSRVPAWWALAGVVILVGWSFVISSWGWQVVAAWIALLVDAALALSAARRALPDVIRDRG